jgi:hypothetical protein
VNVIGSAGIGALVSWLVKVAVKVTEALVSVVMMEVGRTLFRVRVVRMTQLDEAMVTVGYVVPTLKL